MLLFLTTYSFGVCWISIWNCWWCVKIIRSARRRCISGVRRVTTFGITTVVVNNYIFMRCWRWRIHRLWWQHTRRLFGRPTKIVDWSWKCIIEVIRENCDVRSNFNRCLIGCDEVRVIGVRRIGFLNDANRNRRNIQILKRRLWSNVAPIHHFNRIICEQWLQKFVVQRSCDVVKKVLPLNRRVRCMIGRRYNVRKFLKIQTFARLLNLSN